MVDFLLDHLDPTHVLLKDESGRTAADLAMEANFPHLADQIQRRIDAVATSFPYVTWLEFAAGRGLP